MISSKNSVQEVSPALQKKKNALNLALSTTSISQQHCLQFQIQTGEVAPRSKVAHGVNPMSVILLSLGAYAEEVQHASFYVTEYFAFADSAICRSQSWVALDTALDR